MIQAQMGDVLAVRLADGSEALVQAHVHPMMMNGRYDQTRVRVIVLKPTGGFTVFRYTNPIGVPCTPYEYTLPGSPVPDENGGADDSSLPLFRILSWDELQPLRIIPLYREIDARNGAAYALVEHEADAGAVVAARNFLRDRGYLISPATRPRAGSSMFLELDHDRFDVRQWFQPGEIWTCEQLVAKAVQLRNAENEAATSGTTAPLPSKKG